jgi:hypothetical protein
MLAETDLDDLERFTYVDDGLGAPFVPVDSGVRGPQVFTWPDPRDDDSDWANDEGPVRLDNAALLDETTFYVARRLIRGELPLTPMTVMDLSTYVTAFVLREHVVRNKFRGTRPAGGPTEPTTAVDGVIRDASTGSDNALWNARLWEHRLRSGDPAEAPLADALLDGWRTLLGSATPELSQMFLDDPDPKRMTVAEVVNGLRLDGSMTGAGSTQELTNAVAFSNLRGLYNLEFARDLGVPYAGSVTRLPIRRYLWRQGRLGEALVTAASGDLSVSRTLDDAFRKQVREAVVQHEATIVLPPLLAVIVDSIRTLDEFHDRLAELRDQAAAFRSRVTEIEAALKGTGAQRASAERDMFEAFADEARIFSGSLGQKWAPITATVGAVASAATAQSPWITAAIALIGVSGSISPRKIDAARNRLTRRHLWFLTNLGELCRTIHDASPTLRRLWEAPRGRAFDDAFADQLAKVQRLGHG